MKILVCASIALLVASFTGCAKVGSQAGKTLIGAEKVAVKGAPTLERTAAGRTAGSIEGAAAPAVATAEQGTISAARRWATRINKWADTYDKAVEAGDILSELLASPPAVEPQSFPGSLSDVRPISQQRLAVNPESGNYSLPNNVGGFIFYTSRGTAMYFCAYHTKYGEMHFFNAQGRRIG